MKPGRRTAREAEGCAFGTTLIRYAGMPCKNGGTRRFFDTNLMNLLNSSVSKSWKSPTIFAKSPTVFAFGPTSPVYVTSLAYISISLFLKKKERENTEKGDKRRPTIFSKWLIFDPLIFSPNPQKQWDVAAMHIVGYQWLAKKWWEMHGSTKNIPLPPARYLEWLI